MNDALDAVLGDHALDEVFVAGVADEQRHAFGQEAENPVDRLSITTTLSPASASA